MIEKLEPAEQLFFKDGICKDIECIRVDRSTDEGPNHLEVQFLWTERHISKPTRVTLVTTRCSGDGYLNRAELQNGCLSRGHSNLFIPSTLHGSSFASDGGHIDETKYIENMSAAVEQYINRVNGTPCMNTVIHLAKGADNISIEISRRPKLLVFLKGSKAAKDTLKKEDPMLYQYFSEVWSVRHNHMDNTVPGNYIFLLRCCAREGCPHPLCQSKF